VKFNLGGSASAFQLPLHFEPCQSLLLRVSKTGRVERLDAGYVPPTPGTD
jgi:hypothetical protein